MVVDFKIIQIMLEIKNKIITKEHPTNLPIKRQEIQSD